MINIIFNYNVLTNDLVPFKTEIEIIPWLIIVMVKRRCDYDDKHRI